MPHNLWGIFYALNGDLERFKKILEENNVSHNKYGNNKNAFIL